MKKVVFGLFLSALLLNVSARTVATNGAAGVGPQGAATYSIPIVVPPGIGGIEPKLSLEYSSNGANGLLGMGWSLSGLSAITRCPATRAIDGVSGAINFKATDKFCLAGQRLISASGIYGTAGSTYRTEQDGFSLITANGATGTGPSSFTVKTKQGLTLQYGASSDSAILATGKDSVRVWAVNKVSDSFGNFMTVSYQLDGDSGSYLPQNMQYTGNGAQATFARVDFKYGTRSDVLPLYVGGSVAKNTKLLTSIETYVAGEFVKRYELSYRNQTYGSTLSVLTGVQEVFADGSKLPKTVLNWPALNDMGSNCGAQCAQLFDTVPQLLLEDKSQSFADWSLMPGDFNSDGRNDLLAFLVSSSEVNIQPWISDASGKPAKKGPVVKVTLSENNKKGNLLVGDINGDGVSDAIVLSCATTTDTLTITIFNGTGDGTFTPGSTKSYPGHACASVSNYKLLDQAGNGRANLMWVAGSGSSIWVKALLNNGVGGFAAPIDLNLPTGVSAPTGYDTTNIPTDPWFFLLAPQPSSFSRSILWTDIDNDGVNDVVIMYVKASSFAIQYLPGRIDGYVGAAVTLFSASGAPGVPGYTYQGNYSFQFVDVNADGSPDLMAIAYGPNGMNADVWMNTGAGQFTSVKSNVLGNVSVDASKFLPSFGEVNGDGYVDLVYTSFSGAADTPVTYTFLGNGDGTFTQAFGQSAKKGSAASMDEKWSALASDSRGSGRADLLAWTANAGGLSVYRWNNRIDRSPLLMSSVDNGVGHLSEFSYSTLGDASVYTAGGPTALPLVNQIAPLNVVSSLAVPDGIGGKQITNYTYEAYRQEMGTGRGGAGFGKMTSRQAQNGGVLTTASEFNQLWPYTGMSTKSVKTMTLAGGAEQKISETVNSFACIESLTGSSCAVKPGQVFFPYIRQSIEKTWDLDGTPYPWVSRSFNFDSFGNMVTNITSTGDGFSKSVTNTFSNNAAAWIVGRLTAANVVSASPTGSITRSSAYTYHATNGALLSETIEPAQAQLCKVTSYTYDGFGNKVGATTANCVGASGKSLFSSRTSASSYAATVANPIAGQFATQETNPLGHQETREFERKFGGLTKLTGPNQLTVTKAFDSIGRPTLETTADGNRFKTEYLYCSPYIVGGENCPSINGVAVATLVKSTPLAADGVTQNGPWTKEYIDILGRKLRMETQGFDDGGLSVSIYQDTRYDSMGQVSGVSRPYYAGQTVYWTANVYDALGRLSIASNHDGRETRYSYSGFTTQTTNPLGQVTSTIKNSQGQVAKVVDAAGKATLYSYDALGNLVKTVDVEGNVISMVYDVRGRKIQMTDPHLGTWNYVYNALDQLVQQTDSKGAVSTMSYDLLGRLTSRTEADLVANWYFDTYAGGVSCNKGIGKLCQSTTTTGYLKKNVYDNLGRILSTSTTLDVPYVSSRSYDVNGRIAGIVYPSGMALDYTYTPLGYLKSVKRQGDTSALWESRTMDAEGHTLEAKLGNGVFTNTVYKPTTGQVQEITATLGSKLQHVAYEYDAIGKVISRADRILGVSDTLSYDAQNRMTQAIVNTSGSLLPETFEYSDAGNINQRSGVGQYFYSTVIAPSNPGYGCESGVVQGTGPSAVCLTYTPVTRSVDYSCPAGSSLEGENCRLPNNGVTPATAAYSCPSGTTMIGTGASAVCRKVATLPASIASYACPSGFTLTGSICSKTTVTAASSADICLGTTSKGMGGCYSSWGQSNTTEAFCRSQGNTFGLTYWKLTPTSATTNACLYNYAKKYSCPSGQTLLGSTCTAVSTAAATPSYACSTGTLSGSNCVITTNDPVVTTYSCPAGKTVNGSNCLSPNDGLFAATATYSCPSGSTGTGSGISLSCTSVSSVPATPNVKCPSNATFNGSACVYGQAIEAVASNSCPAGSTLSGSSCTKYSSVPASIEGYSCSAGYTLSGSNCLQTVVTAATATNKCIGTTTSAVGGCYSVWGQPEKVSEDFCISQGKTFGLNFWRLEPTSTKPTYACLYYPLTTYSCPAGKTLSGASCVTNVSTASAPVYRCSAGSLSGANCTIPVVETATLSYSCPAGRTLVGRKCVDTIAALASTSYSCAAGVLTGTGASSTCVTTSTSVAPSRYVCTTGTVTGSNCKLANGTYVPATSQRYCTTGVLNGTNCVVSSSTAAKAASVCPAGLTLSGTSCLAVGTLSAKPYAVSFIKPSAGMNARSYSYDTAGNRVSEQVSDASGVKTSSGYTYTSFHMPLSLSLTKNSTTYSESYNYGPEHQRVRQISLKAGSTYYLHPGSAGDLFFEKTIGLDNSIELRNFVSVNGSLIAIVTQKSGASSGNGEQIRYVHQDGLGSTSVVSDAAGSVVERMSYEPFGKRRQTTGAADWAGSIAGQSTKRGFTSHEHLEELGLIHMNGRLYDPTSGRFLSADPLISLPYNSQGYNRYTYIHNSPLNGVDMSGYCFICDPFKSISDTVNHWGDVIRTDPVANFAVSMAVAYFTGQYVGGASPTAWGAMAGGFSGGLVSSGGNMDAAIRGAVTAGMFFGVGTNLPYGNTTTQALKNVAGHATVGCISAVAGGGDCRSGAISAGISVFASHNMPTVIKNSNSVALKTAYSALVGGITAEASGGKFEHGAVTATYGYLFNELMHQTSKAQRGYGESAWDRDQAMERYRSGAGGVIRIDTDTLDFGGLTDSGWDSNNRKTFTFRNTQDYGVHGTVTIQKVDADTFTVRPETYNNDHKQSLGVLHPRNVATAINRSLHGSGQPFGFEFDGARRFDKLGRGP